MRRTRNTFRIQSTLCQQLQAAEFRYREAASAWRQSPMREDRIEAYGRAITELADLALEIAKNIKIARELGTYQPERPMKSIN